MLIFNYKLKYIMKGTETPKLMPPKKKNAK
jgi:hypothetical protein